MPEKQELVELRGRMAQARVLCVGDAMLDRYTRGVVERMSPDAPVPVLRVTEESETAGGAGNVAVNLAALGVRTVLCALTGADTAAGAVARLLEGAGVDARLVSDPARPTVVKHRFLRGGEHLLRVDHEKPGDIDAALEDALARAAELEIPRVGAVILSDYNKGVLTPRVIARVTAAARAAGVPVIVDPKARDFRRYAGADIIKPNRAELEAAAGIPAGDADGVRAACMKIIRECGAGAVLATLSEQGMMLVSRDAAPQSVPALATRARAVVGAGDTVIAAFAAALAAGGTRAQALRLAACAAAIAVGRAGTTAVSAADIAASIPDMDFNMEGEEHDEAHIPQDQARHA